MLTLVLALKLLAEIALSAMVGQAVLAWWLGNKRHGNLCYELLAVVARPPVRWVAA